MAGAGPRFELLTPPGPGGVAVLAVRGADRWELVRPLLGAAPPPPAAGPRLAELRLGGAVVDQVLLVDRPGQGQLELHLHGSPALLGELRRALGGFAAAPARRGDELLRRAAGPEQVALALEQQGLDFAGFLATAAGPDLDAALARSRVALALARPRRVVLCGDQNAGKSTLMNRLLFQERVVTGDLPGLTRDPVCEPALLDGYPYELIDTAGEGEAPDEVGRRALELARSARRDGLLLLVVDGSRPPSPSDRSIRTPHTVVVRNKADLPAAGWPEGFAADVTVSCLDPLGAPAVRRAVGAALRARRGLPPAGPAGGVAALDDDERGSLLAARDRSSG